MPSPTIVSPVNFTSDGFVVKRFKSELAQIEVLVCLTFILLMIQFPISLLRKRYSSGTFKVLAYGAYTAINLLIPYTFGLMLNLRQIGVYLVLIWSVFLLVAYIDVTSVLSPYDSSRTGSPVLKVLIYFVYIVLLLRPRVVGVKFDSFWRPTVHPSQLILLLSINLPYRAMSVIGRRIVKFDGGKRLNINYIGGFKYLSGGSDDNDNDNDGGEMSSDNVLLGCNYVVDPFSIKVKDGKIVDRGTTIQKIWRDDQHGSFLNSTNEQVQDLKKTCISFSLFWLLLNRFAGIPPYESSHQEEGWRFVRHGLIDHQSGHTFPFRVIEVELAFLCDYLYGKHFNLYHPLLCEFFLMSQFLFLETTIRVATFLFSSYDEHNEKIGIRYHNLNVDIIVTGIVITTITLLEIAHIIILFNSRWAKMSLLCTLFSKNRVIRCLLTDRIKKAAVTLCPIHWELFKPWQRKLGQYSLIQSCTSGRNILCRCVSHIFMEIIGNEIARPGRSESPRIILSDDIMVAVIESLKGHGRNLSNGITSLMASGLPQETITRLAWACTQLETDAQVVLVWHIATSICEYRQISPLDGSASDKFRVATSLSKYCAYLVVFAPNLIPGHPAVTDYTCSKAISDAYTLLKDCELSDKYEKLKKITIEIVVDQRNKSTLIHQGAFLGELLLNLEIVALWKLLADVWSEMILYLAPNSHNEWDHAERLLDGGEFITHLWALLFHAGIVDRDSLRNAARDASTATI